MVVALVRFEMFALLTGTKLLARSAGLLSPCNYGGGGCLQFDEPMFMCRTVCELHFTARTAAN